MSQRLDYLDFFKGIAILGVVLAHYSILCPSPNHIIGALCTSGSRCPQLFFIISAFLTWYSLDRKDIGVLAFWKKRFAKIAPLYYVALLLTGLFPVVLLSDWSLLNIVSHITFTNGLFPSYINSLMGVEWYIADLGLFYLMCPLLRKVAYNLNSTVICFMVSVAISIVFTITTNSVFAEHISNLYTYETFFHTFCIINQLPVLFLGVLLYYCHKQKSSDTVTIKRIKIVAVAITIIVSLFFVLFHLNKIYMTSSLVAGLMFFCVLLYISDIQSIKWGGVISGIGKRSYGIYCIHICIIRCVGHFLDLNHDLLPVIQWCGLFVMVLFLSVLVGRTLERYIQL